MFVFKTQTVIRRGKVLVDNKIGYNHYDDKEVFVP